MKITKIKLLKLYFLIIGLSISLVFSCAKNDQNIPCLPKHLFDEVLVFYSFSNGSLDNIVNSKNILINKNEVKFTSDRNNNPNCAAIFDKDNDQYLSTNCSFFNKHQSKAFSISIWYKPIGDKNDYELLVGRSTSEVSCPDKHGEWSIGLYDCRRAVASINQKSIWMEKDSVWQNSSNQNKCKIEILNNTDKWKNIIYTYKDDLRKIYINGKLQNTTQNDKCGEESKNLGDLIIGKLYNGIIDDVIIFKKCLSDSEVNELYNFEACCYKLMIRFFPISIHISKYKYLLEKKCFF